MNPNYYWLCYCVFNIPNIIENTSIFERVKLSVCNKTDNRGKAYKWHQEYIYIKLCSYTHLFIRDISYQRVTDYGNHNLPNCIHYFNDSKYYDKNGEMRICPTEFEYFNNYKFCYDSLPYNISNLIVEPNYTEVYYYDSEYNIKTKLNNNYWIDDEDDFSSQIIIFFEE